MKFNMTLSEEEGKKLDKDRGEISRNAYITQMLRGYRLGVISEPASGEIKEEKVGSYSKDKFKPVGTKENTRMSTREWCRVHMGMEEFRDGRCVKCIERDEVLEKQMTKPV